MEWLTEGKSDLFFICSCINYGACFCFLGGETKERGITLAFQVTLLFLKGFAQKLL